MAINQEELRRHLLDHTAITNKVTEKFVCPITLRICEEADLMDGHILNRKLMSASRKTVIQFRGVDGYYGTHTEPALIRYAPR